MSPEPSRLAPSSMRSITLLRSAARPSRNRPRETPPRRRPATSSARSSVAAPACLWFSRLRRRRSPSRSTRPSGPAALAQLPASLLPHGLRRASPLAPSQDLAQLPPQPEPPLPRTPPSSGSFSCPQLCSLLGFPHPQDERRPAQAASGQSTGGASAIFNRRENPVKRRRQAPPPQPSCAVIQSRYAAPVIQSQSGREVWAKPPGLAPFWGRLSVRAGLNGRAGPKPVPRRTFHVAKGT